jgi:hypothetical protein
MELYLGELQLELLHILFRMEEVTEMSVPPAIARCLLWWQNNNSLCLSNNRQHHQQLQ